ncbi:hypothetical protein BD626DRAFT_570068 [Schizophyllum amplum]|uniref:Fungal-type protein kinase domain-containing protein n=1 Tax=Schizophyllum amplum TaxID=97359 RepID=A0A550CC58_9AGAR|nr:hypothetical protein BD626DRAFT_570068 [Auriculariopsis ampla]
MKPCRAARGGQGPSRLQYDCFSQFYSDFAEGWERLAESDINALLQDLQASGTIADGEWTALLERPKQREDAHFSGLETIFEDVLSAAEDRFSSRFSCDSRTTRFVCKPRQTTPSMPSASASETHRVNAMILRVQPSCPEVPKACGSAHNAVVKLRRLGQTAFMADVVSSGEFSLCHDISDTRKNEDRTLIHAAHTLFNDEGRDAMFAFTIEWTKMRISWNNRSHSAFTRVFDIHAEPAELIHFILFISYAQLSQLGFDPTVRRVVDKEGLLQYQFDFCNAQKAVTTTYETQRILVDSEENALQYRATRVFAVRRVLVNAELAKDRILDDEVQVLRDCWPGSEDEDESAIQKRLLDGLDAWPAIKQHFLDIEEDDVVMIPPYEGQASLAAPYLAKYCLRKHCRTVYKQLCTDLYSIYNPALFFFALSQIIKVLRHFKLAGFLYRDVSPGNVLLHHKSGKLPPSVDATKPEDWLTKVTDLEFARPYLDDSLDYGKAVGTGHYVAVEVQCEQYKFRRPKTMSASERCEARLTSKPEPDFAYNFYHDVESVLWLALEFVFTLMSPKIKDLTTQTGREANNSLYRHACGMRVHPKLDVREKRTAYIKEAYDTRNLHYTLRHVYGDDTPLKKVPELVTSLREAYHDLEDNFGTDLVALPNGRTAINPKHFKDDIYDKMEAAFLDISNFYAQPDNAEVFVMISGPPAHPSAGFDFDWDAPDDTDEEGPVSSREDDCKQSQVTKQQGAKARERAKQKAGNPKALKIADALVANDEIPAEVTLDSVPEGRATRSKRKRNATEQPEEAPATKRKRNPPLPTRASARIAAKQKAIAQGTSNVSPGSTNRSIMTGMKQAAREKGKGRKR